MGRTFTILSQILISSLVLNLIHHQSTIVVQVEGAPIPAKFDGFVHGNPKSFNPENVVIEAFFDPVCPDTRDSWPPLKRILHNYGSKLSLVVHPFPLPYHDNAYVSSRAIHIVNELNSSATFPLWESFFKDQENFYNKKTSKLSRTAIFDHIADFVGKSIGHKYQSAVKKGLNDTNTDLKTRISFKYGCSRGVSGTPTFFVNGIVLPDADSPIDYKGWKKIIDPIVHSNSKTDHRGRH